MKAVIAAVRLGAGLALAFQAVAMAVAMPISTGFVEFGHNGAWTLSAKDDGRCLMEATGKLPGGDSATLGIMVHKEAGSGDFIATDSKVNTFSRKGLAVISDSRTGETLLAKQMQSEASPNSLGWQIAGADLVPAELSALMLVDTGQRHPVHIVFGAIDFTIAIQGAMQAYKNVSSCAGR